ncbi:MAG TPA: hypothetical protein VFH29_03090 [Anaerolineales bacterium]|nr:hypothetical protein [Anaerolineales bacterium]
MGIGKSKARRYDQEQNTKVTFDDVAGIDKAENELLEIVDSLKEHRHGVTDTRGERIA